MNADLVECALRGADPVAELEQLPPAAAIVAAALQRCEARSRPTWSSHPRRWVLAVTAAAAVTAAITVPLTRSTPAPRTPPTIRLVAFHPAAPQPLPFGIAMAPAGWALAGAKKGDGVPGAPDVVGIAPPGQNMDSRDSITIMHYSTPRPGFPDGMQGRGPVSSGSSDGRPLIVMQGEGFWAAQISLPDGSALVLLLPKEMDRAQVQTFVDGVTVR